MSEDEIEERRVRFKADVRKLTPSSVVDRHVIFGDSYILADDPYFKLKEQIAEHFKIHPPQVVMVGSGKLGFSIVDKKRYRSFGEISDLDIAIVTPNLFDRIWEEVFRRKGQFGIWPEESRFSLYLARGWIRPDTLPLRNFGLTTDWWKFFDSLAASGEFGRYRIRGGLYRDWAFLKGYQTLAVLGCKEDLESKPEEVILRAVKRVAAPKEPEETKALSDQPGAAPLAVKADFMATENKIDENNGNESQT